MANALFKGVKANVWFGMFDTMKISNSKSLVVAFTAIFAACLAHGQVFSTNVSTTVNTAIPDGNPTGMTSTANISTLPVGGTITSVTVTLDITGGFNGDLYAYLAGPVGGFSVLLNRTGITSGNSIGYSDPGFNVTFSDSSTTSIHLYQLNSPTFDSGTGQLLGTWAPDGNEIDPQSNPSAFSSTSANDLTSFLGNAANGNWNLFVADLSSGGQSTLVNWGLTVVTTPEPQTWLLVAGGIGLLFVFNRGRKL